MLRNFTKEITIIKPFTGVTGVLGNPDLHVDAVVINADIAENNCNRSFNAVRLNRLRLAVSFCGYFKL